MSDLTDFLLARITEDKESAYAYREVEPAPGRRYNFSIDTDDQIVYVTFEDGSTTSMPWAEFQREHMERHLARPRVLAECEAKRRIVERHKAALAPEAVRRSRTLLDLAAVYADHPDYQETWKP